MPSNGYARSPNCVCGCVEGRMLIHIENHILQAKAFEFSCHANESNAACSHSLSFTLIHCRSWWFARPSRARQVDGTDMGAKWNWKRLKLREIDVICSMIWSDQRDIRKYGTKHDTCRKLTHAILRPNRMNEAVKATYARIKRCGKKKNGRKM